MTTTKPAGAAATGGLQAGILGWGLLATVLVMLPGAAAATDRHDLPKELLVHLIALAAAAVALARARWVRPGTEDVALAAFLALGLASSAAAVNPWLAARASALACSAAAAFWAARAADGRTRRRIAALAAGAVAMAAVTSLLEAYGVVDGLSLDNRAPGGTLGHRNRLAHLLVLGLPLLGVQLLAAKDRARVAGWCAALAASGAAVTLTRSRAAWVAMAVVAVVLVAAAVLVRPRVRAALPGRRLALGGGALLLGAAVAVVAPNRLGWRSPSPYRDSLATIVDHREGSGRGRMIQYRNTLRMAADQPLLGVGPGNWTIRYPEYASPGDPSYTPTERLPTGRYPQGDWVALVAERGIPAAIAALAAGLVLLARCARALRRVRPARPSRAAAGLALGAALAVLGLLDAVLMTPAAALLAAVALGALVPPGRSARRVEVPRPARTAIAAGAMAVLAAGVLVSTAGTGAAWIYGSSRSPENLARAVRVNPGDFYAQLVLGETLANRGQCDQALPALNAATRLFPAAPLPRRLERRCRARLARRPAAAADGTPRAGPPITETWP